MGALFGLEHLITTEQQTWHDTEQYLPKLDLYHKCIDTLFKIIYFTGQATDSETVEGGFHSSCYYHYCQAPYTFSVAYNLTKQGHYLETMILIRHLLETFLQIRYFGKYPDKLKKHIIAKKSQDRVSFKKMFDEFSIKSYDRWYGQQLSRAAHCVIYKTVFRAEATSPTEVRPIMGCEYSPQNALYLFHHQIVFIYGFLSMFTEFFPMNNLSGNKAFVDEYKRSIGWIRNYIEEHRHNNPNQHEWLDDIESLVGKIT